MAQQVVATTATTTCTHDAIQLGIHRLVSFAGSKLFVDQNDNDPQIADEQHVHYLINHLNNFASVHAVVSVRLFGVRFSDAGFNAWLSYLASDTTPPSLTEVSLNACDYGGGGTASGERCLQLVTAMRTKASVTNLTIDCKWDEHPTLDSDNLVRLLEKNNVPLRKLSLNGFNLRLVNADALRRALGNIPHLKEFSLLCCGADDATFQVIIDGLVGNTTEVLGTCSIPRTSNALQSNISRLLESTRLKVLKCGTSLLTLHTSETTQRFATALSTNTFITTLDMADVVVSTSAAVVIFQALVDNSTLQNLTFFHFPHLPLLEFLPNLRDLRSLELRHWSSVLQSPLLLPALRENTSLEALPGLDADRGYRYNQYRDEITEINGFLIRNRRMRHVRCAQALVALQPRTGLPLANKSGIWCMAMAQLGRDSAGASAIFYILTTRPAILEKQLKRPSSSSSTQQGATGVSSHRRHRQALAEQEHATRDGSSNNENVASAMGGGKRARRS